MSDTNAFGGKKLRETPCRRCNKRSSTCHTTCEDYLSWKAEYDAFWSEVNRIKAQGAMVDSFRSSNIWKAVKRKRYI